MTDIETMKRVLANQQEFTIDAVRQDYADEMEITAHPERIFGHSVFWAVLVCIISGFVFGLAVFGG